MACSTELNTKRSTPWAAAASTRVIPMSRSRGVERGSDVVDRAHAADSPPGHRRVADVADDDVVHSQVMQSAPGLLRADTCTHRQSGC
jgi:hypothetical protein